MADSQRKTANLFDKSNGSYNAYVDDAGTWRYVDTAKSVKIPCSANTTYTLSVPENLSVFRIYEISDASAEPPTQAAEIIRSGGIVNYTFTTASTTAAIIFQGSAGNFDGWFNGLMLNTGSSPLPYEPYGWVHSLRKLTTATDTITTLPAVLYPNAVTATVGLKGQMEQSDTPTPQNPITPSECGDITENLFDKTTAVLGERVYTDRVSPDAGWAHSDYIDIDGLSYITVSKRAAITTFYFYENKTTSCTSYYQGNIAEVPEGAKYVRINMAVDDVDSNMLVSGSTDPSSYIPYGYKLTISSANTTTPVYLGEVESTRKIRKLVLTGGTDKEYVYDPTYTRFYFVVSDILGIGVRLTPLYCTHYQNISDGRPVGDVPNNSIYTGGGVDTDKVFIKIADYTSVTDFKAYLQQQYANGTPVTVWYVLATEETGIVNEPLRKIGEYADTVSGITIPTITGKDTFDVDTSLKPSEVSLAYTGWHGATVEEWDGSQWNE